MAKLTGVVQSGGTSTVDGLGGAQVRLCNVSSGTVSVTLVTADPSGAFVIETSETTSEAIFYVTANYRGAVVLMALLGPSLPAGPIVVNELTTVAAVYCAAQFFVNGALQGDPFGLRIAALMSTNLVTLSTGESSPVMTSSPNDNETNSLRSTRALANLLAMCIKDPDEGCHDLFEAATPPGGSAPLTTIAAMLNIALYPANSAGALYKLSKKVELYQPALEHQPDAWTLVVKVNDSGSDGDDGQMLGGPANLVFDSRGNAWITNNVIQGQAVSTAYCIVLGPDGKPALNATGVTMSPFTGGGICGPGFGIDLDSQERVWIGNFGWAKDFPPGSVSLFDSSDASALSPEAGYPDGVYRVQATIVDDADNVWLASFGNNSVVVYPGGDASAAVVFTGPSSFAPFGIAIASDGTAWVTNSNADNSGIYHFRFTPGTPGSLDLIGHTRIGQVLKGIVIDSSGTIWAASGGNAHVYAFDSEGTVIGGYQGGGTDGPWGICLDGADNIWVGNFGPLEPGSVFTGRLTQLAGVNATHDRVLLGDAMTPPTGYTLPSAGAPVMLNDNTPLYGTGTECFTPMMRTTGATVDAAGNVWTCNNWKPDFDNDTIGGNPGGDGILIWIGLAKPRGWQPKGTV
jgi:hypothetical protein